MTDAVNSWRRLCPAKDAPPDDDDDEPGGHIYTLTNEQGLLDELILFSTLHYITLENYL